MFGVVQFRRLTVAAGLAVLGCGPNEPESSPLEATQDAPTTPERVEDPAEALVSARIAERGALLERTRGMNVLLVVVDAMRADLLEDTEANRGDFPNLFRLQSESRTFSRAFAPGAGTDLSMSGVFTGRVNPWDTVDTTLAEAMGASGRRTHAVVPNEVFYFAGKTLLVRGFDTHKRLINDLVERNVSSYATSKRTTTLVQRFLDEWAAENAEAETPEPFFAWVHYFDVHEHHQVPTGDRNLLAANDGKRGETPGEKYRALARLVDQEVGALLDGLRESGELEDTIVVLMSDHGEGLSTDPRLPEHHGQFIYNDLVHVPMMIRVPGVEPQAVDQAVSLIDLYPTMIELAGGTGSPQADAVSLVPHLIETPPAEADEPRVLALNEVEQYGLVRWPHKLMVDATDGHAEVYDLSTDWDEKQDLSGSQPELTTQLRHAYEQLPPVVVDRTRKARRSHELAARKQTASEAPPG